MRLIWKMLRILAGLLLLVVGLSWLIGEFTFPSSEARPTLGGTILSTQSDALLKRACFDCHSDSTVRPWYSHLPVANLIMGHHVREGREEVNFSRWASMSNAQRRKAISESIESIEKEEMPDPGYLLLHPEAALRAGELAMLWEDARRLGLLEEGNEGHARRDHGDNDGDDDDDRHERHRD